MQNQAVYHGREQDKGPFCPADLLRAGIRNFNTVWRVTMLAKQQTKGDILPGRVHTAPFALAQHTVLFLSSLHRCMPHVHVGPPF